MSESITIDASRALGSGEGLDLETVAKASQTLSGEVKLEELLKKLMDIVRENAGAEKGILLLQDEASNNLVIQAESIGDQEVKLLAGQMLNESEEISQGLVQYVARSQENIVLGNRKLL